MNENNPSDRRERKAAAMRQLILDTAAIQFAEKGFHRTTTRDIALAADVSEGTIYNYFENKSELLLGIIAQLSTAQQEELKRDISRISDPRALLLEALQDDIEFSKSKRPMLQAVLSEILVDPTLRQRYYRDLVLPMMKYMQDLFQGYIHAGQVRTIPSQYLVRMVLCIFTGLFFLEVLEDDVVLEDSEKFSQVMADVIFEGLLPPSQTNGLPEK